MEHNHHTPPYTSALTYFTQQGGEMHQELSFGCFFVQQQLIKPKHYAPKAEMKQRPPEQITKLQAMNGVLQMT